MSIRDELASLLDRHLSDRDNAQGCRLACGYDGDDRCEHLADAILARFAVVERPEANGGPMGIEWASNGGHVTGRVLAIGDDGQPFEILTITYTVEQAAQMATHLIDAIGGKR